MSKTKFRFIVWLCIIGHFNFMMLPFQMARAGDNEDLVIEGNLQRRTKIDVPPQQTGESWAAWYTRNSNRVAEVGEHLLGVVDTTIATLPKTMVRGGLVQLTHGDPTGIAYMVAATLLRPLYNNTKKGIRVISRAISPSETVNRWFGIEFVNVKANSGPVATKWIAGQNYTDSSDEKRQSLLLLDAPNDGPIQITQLPLGTEEPWTVTVLPVVNNPSCGPCISPQQELVLGRLIDQNRNIITYLTTYALAAAAAAQERPMIIAPATVVYVEGEQFCFDASNAPRVFGVPANQTVGLAILPPPGGVVDNTLFIPNTTNPNVEIPNLGQWLITGNSSYIDNEMLDFCFTPPLNQSSLIFSYGSSADPINNSPYIIGNQTVFIPDSGTIINFPPCGSSGAVSINKDTLTGAIDLQNFNFANCPNGIYDSNIIHLPVNLTMIFNCTTGLTAGVNSAPGISSNITGQDFIDGKGLITSSGNVEGLRRCDYLVEDPLGARSPVYGISVTDPVSEPTDLHVIIWPMVVGLLASTAIGIGISTYFYYLSKKKDPSSELTPPAVPDGTTITFTYKAKESKFVVT